MATFLLNTTVHGIVAGTLGYSYGFFANTPPKPVATILIISSIANDIARSILCKDHDRRGFDDYNAVSFIINALTVVTLRKQSLISEKAAIIFGTLALANLVLYITRDVDFSILNPFVERGV